LVKSGKFILWFYFLTLKETTTSQSGHTDVHSKNTEPLIAWVRSIVVFFESGGASELPYLRGALQPFARPDYWIQLKRRLSAYYALQLFEQLTIHKWQIDAILSLPSDAANEPVYNSIESRTSRSRQQKPEGLDGIAWEDDIIMLYRTHFSGLGWGLTIDDIRWQKTVLLWDSRTRDAYEVRLEEYRTNYTLFIEHFCPWMKNIIP